MIKQYITMMLGVVAMAPMITLAVDPSSFRVEVTPETFQVDEPVNLKISALDSDGNVVSDFDGNVFITVNLPQAQYVVPSDGIYTFLESDQGEKLFSKGLMIKEPGEFKITIEDLFGAVSASTTVIVSDGDDDVVAGSQAVLISPQAGTVYEGPKTINIIGSSEVPNTPVSYVLNGLSGSANVSTDANGGFSFYITDFAEGENLLSIAITNTANDLLASSDPLTFSVTSAEEVQLLKTFFINPEGVHYTKDPLTVGLSTDARVGSAELVVNGSAYPLDSVGVGQFGRELVLNTEGTYEISVLLYVEGESTNFPQDPLVVVAKPGLPVEPPVKTPVVTPPVTEPISPPGTVPPVVTPPSSPSPTDPSQGSAVDDITGIGTIKAVIDPNEKTSAHVSRTTIGEIEYFLVRYGQNPGFLDKQIIVVHNELRLEQLEENTRTYVQVWPSDASGNAVGVPSDPVTLDIGSHSPPCIVRGISLDTEQIDDRYYLTWEEVDHVSEYIVYRSASAVSTISQMSEVGRTTLPSYPYPFDKTADANEYAYFAVEAVCDDGSLVRVDTIKKVQVGPMTNVLMILLTALLAYFVWRLFALSKD